MPRTWSKIAIGVILVFLAVYYFPVMIQHLEQPHRKYTSYDREMFAGSWIPDLFPVDVQNIHEQHDIDTNEVWVRVDAGETNFTKATLNTQAVYASEIEISGLSRPMHAEWWFDSLDSNTPIYRGVCNNDMVSYFFISKENKAYWWCQHEA
jgi:hypothetical protein